MMANGRQSELDHKIIQVGLRDIKLASLRYGV